MSFKTFFQSFVIIDLAMFQTSKFTSDERKSSFRILFSMVVSELRADNLLKFINL